MLTNNKMISLRRNHIYNSDSIEILEKIPSNSIDVIYHSIKNVISRKNFACLLYIKH